MPGAAHAAVAVTCAVGGGEGGETIAFGNDAAEVVGEFFEIDLFGIAQFEDDLCERA